MAFVKNAWYVACRSGDVKIGEMFHRKLLDEPVVFYRKKGGELVALQDRCPHRFIPLHLGKVVDDVVECAYHGLQFDCSGKCVKNPHGDGRIPAAAKVRHYPVYDKHTLVWIWMGDEPADPSSIPDYSVIDEDSGYLTSGGYLHIAANYELMGENLLDLSHIAYLHDGYLGSPEQSGAEQELVQEGDQLLCKRWASNVPVPGIFDMVYRQDGKPVDAWTNMRWIPPSCFLLDAGVHAVGGQREDHGWYYGIHILTPETSNTTHYNFVAAMPSGTRLSPEEDEKFRSMRRHAFEVQDKPIIDAQQEAIGDADFWSLQPVLLSVDAGPVRMRRTLERMVREEQEKAAAKAARAGTAKAAQAAAAT